MMTYAEARAFLSEEKREIHLGLSRMRALLGRLGNPERELRFLHIAGTNGKGSILAFLSAALTKAGYRVGRYASPVVFSYGEQFQVDGRSIDELSFVRHSETIFRAVEELESAGCERPTSFELETALAFLYFREERCDYVVLECGMGGRDDATNIIPPPEAAVFSSISLDHTAYLGNTVREITENKAGILKAGCSLAVSGPQEEPAVLAAHCAKLAIPFVTWSAENIVSVKTDGQTTHVYTRDVTLTTSLTGSHQVGNLLTAYTALKALQKRGLSITDAQITEGLAGATWPGRFTQIAASPPLYIDGAHNPDAARQLANTLRTQFAGTKWIFLFGMFRDKDVDRVIAHTAPLSEEIFTIAAPDNQRALPAAELAAHVRIVHPRVTACDSLTEALVLARSAAQTHEANILAFGSLAFLGELTAMAQEVWHERSD